MTEIKQAWHVTLDHLFGVRAWGLVLYGALPANLALLGVVEVKLAKVANLFVLVPVTLIPLLLTFLLIRGRHREWYLTTDLLNVRSVIVTLLIILIATLISGLSGVIHGKYRFSSISMLGTAEYVRIVVESFLLGAGSLVLTSTLFMTIMTKGGDLPGLPPSDVVKQIASIRGKLRQLQSAPIWTDPLADNRKEEATKLKELLEELYSIPGNRLAKMSFERIETSVRRYIEAVETIENVRGDQAKRLNWIPHFASAQLLTEGERLDRSDMEYATHTSLQYLRGLKLGGAYVKNTVRSNRTT